MDPLVEISMDQWPVLQDKLKAAWPINIAGFYALDLNLKCPNVREAFQFKVYSPMGDIELGFVATTVKDNPECIIFSINEDTRKLEEAILSTKLIDWRKLICIDLVSSTTLNLLQKTIIPCLKFSYCKVGTVKTYVLDRETKPFSIMCPLDTYLAPITQKHIERIDETWPYKHAGSHFYFSTLAENHLAQGLYSSTDNQLLAWMILNEYNFLCHLYCEEKHRKKGYAEYVLKSVVNDQLRQGNDVYTYVENDNEISSRLFDKLGFVNVDDGAYLFVQK